MSEGSFKNKILTFFNIIYKPRSRSYWLILGIPQFFFLAFLLYCVATIMINHLMHYSDKDFHFYPPGTTWFIERVGGYTVDAKVDPLSESELLNDTIEAQVFEPRRHFHNLTEDPEVAGKNPICFTCHGNMPHKHNKKIRSLLNMHTGFAACITCHIVPEMEEEIKYKWYNPTDVVVTGEPFGTSYDPKTGALTKTDDQYSLITPFQTVRGKEVSLQLTDDSPEARDYIKIRDKLTAEQQGKVKAKFHKIVTGKGKFCDKCHTIKDGVIDFDALGFSKDRVRDLTGLNIAGIVSKYKQFFIPNLYKATPDKSAYKEDKPVYTDPRSWWRDKYNKDAQ